MGCSSRSRISSPRFTTPIIRSRPTSITRTRSKRPRRAPTAFLTHRGPEYLGYFERVLSDNPAGPAHAVGGALTTVDLSLFQVWAGMAYAFPHAFADAGKRYPALAALAAVGRASSRTSPPISPRTDAFPSTSRAFSAAIPSSIRRRRRRVGGSPEPPRASADRPLSGVIGLRISLTNPPRSDDVASVELTGTGREHIVNLA